MCEDTHTSIFEQVTFVRYHTIVFVWYNVNHFYVLSCEYRMYQLD